jgi:MipA family protein
MKRFGTLAVVSIAVSLAAGTAFAQAAAGVGSVDVSAPDTGTGRSNAIIGFGAGLSPDYEGSENYRVGLVPFARFSYQEYAQYLSLAPNGSSRTYQARLNVLPYEGIEMGPMFDYRRGRKHVENNDVNHLPNVDNAWEAGGFARYWLPLPLPGHQRIALDVSGAADISNAYNGWWIQPGLEYKAPVAETVGLSARVFSDYANSDYMDEFFSIDANQSARSGLRQYDADAGFKDVGLTLGVNWNFAPHWFTGAVATYERMIGDAGSSPVTRSAGDKNQGMGGVYVGYKF